MCIPGPEFKREFEKNKLDLNNLPDTNDPDPLPSLLCVCILCIGLILSIIVLLPPQTEYTSFIHGSHRTPNGLPWVGVYSF